MRRAFLGACVLSAFAACSSSDLHPPTLPDCPTCITNPIIYNLGGGDSSVQDGSLQDSAPGDASLPDAPFDAPLDSPDAAD